MGRGDSHHPDDEVDGVNYRSLAGEEEMRGEGERGWSGYRCSRLWRRGF